MQVTISLDVDKCLLSVVDMIFAVKESSDDL